MMSKELQRPLRGPLRLYTDNLTALQGTEMKNVPVTGRYDAARRAVLRKVVLAYRGAPICHSTSPQFIELDPRGQAPMYGA